MGRPILVAATLTVWLMIGLVVAVFLVAPRFGSENPSHPGPITVKTFVQTPQTAGP